jgi:hypothetical protein
MVFQVILKKKQHAPTSNVKAVQHSYAKYSKRCGSCLIQTGQQDMHSVKAQRV